MTKEETQSAIEWIKGLRDRWNDKDNVKYCNMAIKALEAPPNDNWDGYSSRLWKSAYERGYDEGYKQACKDKIESPYCAEREDKE